ncbi:hypothetical protein EB796_023304 [Bugula neritina]|uniref:Uncharacterized protein n=1 Tax=Bugula neritina TaxID=10212 RepID=A0A7J7IYT0_BUGNE|nr:hypothetical protein EB796_023304 [Bugula neritina]
MTNLSARDNGDEWKQTQTSEQKEIRKTLYSLLEDYLEEVTVEPSDFPSSEEAVDIDIFSKQVRDELMKSSLESSQSRPRKPEYSKAKKRKKSTALESNNTELSSSSSEEDLELLASIAVTASHLGTSNKVQKQVAESSKS